MYFTFSPYKTKHVLPCRKNCISFDMFPSYCRKMWLTETETEAGVSPSGRGGELGRGLDAELHVGVIEVGRGGEGGSHGQELGCRLIHLDLFLQLLDLCLQMTHDTNMTLMTPT